METKQTVDVTRASVFHVHEASWTLCRENTLIINTTVSLAIYPLYSFSHKYPH